MKLYNHQQKFVDQNPNMALLSWEVGCGKSLAAMEWMKKRPGHYTVLVCPKNIKKKWIEDLERNNIDPLRVIVLTKEEFKKQANFITSPRAIIVDEADFFSAPLFTKGRSQMVESLYNFIRINKIENILLLTATPFRNSPHNIHTLLTYLQQAPDWKSWRDKHYQLVSRPYLIGMAYEPKKGWRAKAVEYAVPKIHVARMADIVDVPVQTHNMVRIQTEELTPEQAVADTIIKEWHLRARRESGPEKLDWIKEYIQDKSKVVLVSRYKETIETYEKELSKTRKCYVLTGDSKDQEEIIKEAEADPECILFIQAGIGAGFEIPSFSFMVFINMSFAHRDYIQMQGRILRINRLKSNTYTYLIGGPRDKNVYKAIIEMESDFKI